MVESLLLYANEIKTQYEYKGLDSEADLTKFYNEVRKSMAGQYEVRHFGAVDEGDKKLTKMGYQRIKAKVKEVRQQYRKAVTEGRRSGSGRIVCDNWELLKSIWGGSPATTTISNAVCSFDDKETIHFDEDEDVGEEEEEEEEEEDEIEMAKEKEVEEQAEEKERDEGERRRRRRRKKEKFW